MWCVWGDCSVVCGEGGCTVVVVCCACGGVLSDGSVVCGEECVWSDGSVVYHEGVWGGGSVVCGGDVWGDGSVVCGEKGVWCILYYPNR